MGHWSVCLFISKVWTSKLFNSVLHLEWRLDVVLHGLSGLGIRPMAALAARLSEKQYIWVHSIPNSFESMISTKTYFESVVLL